jgi:hypothetical protein
MSISQSHLLMPCAPRDGSRRPHRQPAGGRAVSRSLFACSRFRRRTPKLSITACSCGAGPRSPEIHFCISSGPCILSHEHRNAVSCIYSILILIYLLTAIGLSPGGSTHLNTNNTQNNTNNNRTTLITNYVEMYVCTTVCPSLYR